MERVDSNASIGSGLAAFEAAQSNSNRLLLAKFVAPHCSSCVTLKPVLEQLVAEYNEQLVLVELDMIAEPELAVNLSVRSVPTVILFRQDQELGRITGLKPKKQYRETIQAAL